MRMAAIDLVCLGDSIVYGYGTYPMGAWPRLAGAALGIRILNQGENGDTADGMNVRFMEDVLYHRPKKSLLWAGPMIFLWEFRRAIPARAWTGWFGRRKRPGFR